MNLLKRISGIALLSLLLFACGESGTSSDGDKLFKNEQFEEAVAAYDKKLKNRPKNVKALYGRGRAYEELGELKKAEESFKKALEQDTKNTQILLSLSNLHHKQKNYELSLMYADNAVEVSGAPPMAYFMKARAMHQLGNVDEARREYNAAIKMSPNYGQAYYYRGMLNQATDDNKQACEDFRKAAENNYEQAQEALNNYCN